MKKNINHPKWNKEKEKCLHKKCKSCGGTGIKKDATPCVHYISCRCKQCNPYTFSSDSFYNDLLKLSRGDLTYLKQGNDRFRDLCKPLEFTEKKLFGVI